MKLFTAIVLSVSALASCSSPKVAYLEHGRARFEERKSFDDADAHPETRIGVLLPEDDSTFRNDRRIVGWAADFNAGVASSDDTIQGATLETDRWTLGFLGRYYFDTTTSLVQPFFGLGPRVQHLHAETSLGEQEDDFRFGLAGTVGIESQLGRVRVGVRYERTFGFDHTLGDLEGQNFDTDALLVNLGWSF